MLRKISLVIALGCGFAVAASAAELSSDWQASSPAVGCAKRSAMSWAAPGTVALASRGGTNGDMSAASCCYSDPCPGWGGYMVSCCAEGCSAWSDRVWCSHTGFIYCPAPPSCSCQQGAQCTGDSDCDCNQGYGYCYKEEPFAIVGTCSCYF